MYNLKISYVELYPVPLRDCGVIFQVYKIHDVCLMGDIINTFLRNPNRKLVDVSIELIERKKK